MYDIQVVISRYFQTIKNSCFTLRLSRSVLQWFWETDGERETERREREMAGSGGRVLVYLRPATPPCFWIWKGSKYSLFFLFFGRLECVGHSFAYVAHFVFLGDVWIRTQRAVRSKQARYQLSRPFPYPYLNIHFGYIPVTNIFRLRYDREA